MSSRMTGSGPRRAGTWAAGTAALLLAAAGALAAPPAGARTTPDGWFAPPPALKPPLPADLSRVFIIPVRRDIDDALADDVCRKLDFCRQQRAQLVVLDIDGWGGAVPATLTITQALKTRPPGIRTVCFVRSRAVGAAAWVALACDEIVMTPVGQLGGGALLGSTEEIPQREREKIESALRAELAESAERAGYNVPLAEKIVAAGHEVWLIRHRRTRELRHVRARDWRGRVTIAPGLVEAPSNDQAEWELLRVAAPAGEILTMHSKEALRLGFASAIVASPPEEPYAALLAHYGAAGEPVVLSATALPASIPATGAPAPPGPTTRRMHPEGHFVMPAPSPDRPPRPSGLSGEEVVIIPIREEITEKTFEAIRRKAAQCLARGTKLIILDMDTWGGAVIAALDIARLMKTDLGGIYKVCYVHTRAISAGALIAMTCDEIIMTPVGKFGDCAPIAMGGQLEGVEREKIESPLRTEFVESARRNGYWPALAESMISVQREVWLIRNKATRELRYVLAKDYRGRVSFTKVTVKGEQSNPAAEWELLRIVLPAGELLTMETKDAQEYGFVSHVVRAPAADPYADLLKQFEVTGSPLVLEDTWSERLVEFLASPLVTTILLLAGLVCLYSEMRMPGFGVLGAIGLACFALLLGSRYLIGIAQWWEIGLFVIGVALLAIEIFLIPGFGVTGIAGIVCCAVALVAMVVPNSPDELPIPSSPLAWRYFNYGILSIASAVVLSTVVSSLVAKYLPKIPVARRIFLGPVEAPPDSPVAQDSPARSVRVGAVGVVEGMCRPVGKVRFGEALLDAASDGDIIPAGTRVRVLRTDGNRIVVEKVENA